MVDPIAEAVLAPAGAVLASRDTRIVERDGWYQVITPSSGTTLGNEIVWSRVGDEEIEATIDRTIADYAGHPFMWCVGPLTEPADTGERLARRGFSSYPIRGMTIDPRTWKPKATRDVVVEPVTAATLDEYCACWSEGWNRAIPDREAWIDDHLRAMASGRFHFYLARVGGVPIGTAGWIGKPRSVYLVGGNVLPEYRSRGAYTALLDARLADVAARGATLATVQAREATSAPILEKLGFATVFRSRIYRSPNADPV